MKGFDFEKLRQAMLERKGWMTYGDMAQEIGICRSTLYRLLTQPSSIPDADTVALCCSWLGVSVETFLLEGPRPNRETTLDKIDRALSADPTLTADAAHRLSDMMRAAYSACAVRLKIKWLT